MAEHALEFKIRQWVEIQRQDLLLKVHRDGQLFGTLKISQGSIDWSPSGSESMRPHVIYWHEFDEFARSKRRGKRVLSAATR